MRGLAVDQKRVPLPSSSCARRQHSRPTDKMAREPRKNPSRGESGERLRRVRHTSDVKDIGEEGGGGMLETLFSCGATGFGGTIVLSGSRAGRNKVNERQTNLRGPKKKLDKGCSCKSELGRGGKRKGGRGGSMQLRDSLIKRKELRSTASRRPKTDQGRQKWNPGQEGKLTKAAAGKGGRRWKIKTTKRVKRAWRAKVDVTDQKCWCQG